MSVTVNAHSRKSLVRGQAAERTVKHEVFSISGINTKTHSVLLGKWMCGARPGRAFFEVMGLSTVQAYDLFRSPCPKQCVHLHSCTRTRFPLEPGIKTCYIELRTGSSCEDWHSHVLQLRATLSQNYVLGSMSCWNGVSKE
eukprot:4155233-Amphidinium_carterae.1